MTFLKKLWIRTFWRLVLRVLSFKKIKRKKMRVDISFDFAKVYNIDKRVDVVLGQKFLLNTDFEGVSKWFTDNDPVLSLVQKGNNAELEATALGSSTVLIMTGIFGIEKELTFNVVASIEQPASDLGATADSPEPK